MIRVEKSLKSLTDGQIRRPGDAGVAALKGAPPSGCEFCNTGHGGGASVSKAASQDAPYRSEMMASKEQRPKKEVKKPKADKKK